MYSHPGEYRKIFLANYLCIGFVPGGNAVALLSGEVEKMLQMWHLEQKAEVVVVVVAFLGLPILAGNPPNT